MVSFQFYLIPLLGDFYVCLVWGASDNFICLRQKDTKEERRTLCIYIGLYGTKVLAEFDDDDDGDEVPNRVADGPIITY